MGDINYEFEQTDLEQFGKILRDTLGPGDDSRNVFNKHMKSVIKKSHSSMAKSLKARTPRGPSGNLRNSVLTVAKEYRKDRKFFGATGYSSRGNKKNKAPEAGKRRKGKGLGYHAGFIEFGTKMRKTEGRIASSFHSQTMRVTNTKRGKNKGMLKTVPKPPRGFFKSAGRGQRVDLHKMYAQGPIRRSAGAARESIGMYIRNNTYKHV